MISQDEFNSKVANNINSDVETTYINGKNIQEGVVVDGVFTGAHSREVKHNGRKFTSTTYFFEGNDGGKYGVSKLGNLGYLMDKWEVQKGDKLALIYKGEIENPEKETSFHTFMIEPR